MFLFHIKFYKSSFTLLIILIILVVSVLSQVDNSPVNNEPVVHNIIPLHPVPAPEPLPETVPQVPQIKTEKKIKVPVFVKKANRFHPIISRVADRYQVDPFLIKAIIMAESGYNPRAISRKGAVGLMQLMPRTAKSLGVTDSFNPEHNIDGGVRYFRQLLDQFDHDVELALAAYNAGSRKVRQYKGVPPFKSTRFYIKKVGEYYLNFKEQNAQHVDNV